MSIDLTQYQVDYSALLNRDQTSNALSWSLNQFQDKRVYTGVLQAFIGEVNELFVAVAELAKTRNIAYGTGAWLDGLGRIVGQARENTSAGVAPTDDDYRDEIIRRTFQNTNQYSSVPEIISAIQVVLGITVHVEQTGVRTIRIDVPTGTPSWKVTYITSRSFDTTTGTYNKWYFPFPACCNVTTGTY